MNVISTEMDKSRDVRRGTTRFSRQQINTNKKQQQQQQSSQPNIFSGGVSVAGAGDFVSLEKVKKEKIRRLSSVNGHRESPNPCPNSNQLCETEMGCDLSSDDREHQCPSHSQHTSSPIHNSATNIFKIPKKLFSDRNVVNHATVPRKLRSVMKKRSRESLSPPLPDSKKPNHTHGGVEMQRKDDLKKPKLKLKQGELDWSRKATVSRPITKDEEEVVETLYALAGMFPDGDSLDKNKMNGEPIEVKSSGPPEIMERRGKATEVIKEDAHTVCHPQEAETVPPSTLEKSANDTAEPNSLNETTTQDKLDLPDSRRPHLELDCTVSQMKLSTFIPTLAKTEPEAEKSYCIPSKSCVLSEETLKIGLKQQHVTNVFERKPEMAFGVAGVESQMAQQHIIEAPRKNGLALWQGLALGSCTPGSSKSFSLESGSSTEKVSKIFMDRKSMKRCATHVYISRLIHNLEMHNKDSILQQPLQLKPHIGLKQIALLYPKNCSNLRNCINGNIGSSNTATDRNVSEARNGILQPKMLQQEQPQVASASENTTSKQQTYDFFSLSAEGISMDANNRSNKVGNAIESLSQLQVPYLHSYQQHQSRMPFSIPATRYSDHFSTATSTQQQVQLQLPQYSSNPFCVTSYTSHSGVTKQQQQQQRLWAAHLAAQYKPGGNSSVLTQFPSWQNGKPESSTSMPYAPNAIPPFPTLDTVGPRYNTAPQHQLPKIAISPSLPPTRVKRPDHHIPSIYEESNGRFRAGGTLPLQLLCDEHL